jgi:hypothetical protein
VLFRIRRAQLGPDGFERLLEKCGPEPLPGRDEDVRRSTIGRGIDFC